MYSIKSTSYWSTRNVRDIFIVIILTTAIVVVPIIVVENNRDNSYDIPPLKPPVGASVPRSLEDTSRRLLSGMDEFSFGNQVKDRFFTNEGPTSVYRMLSDVDDRTRSLNARSSESPRPCLSTEPIEIALEGWPGEDQLSLWIQCYEELSQDLFIMFGKKDDRVYLYERGSAATITAVVTLTPPDHSDEFPCCYQVGGGGSDCTCDNGSCILTGTDTVDGGTCRTKNDTSMGTNIQTLVGNSSSMAEVNIFFSVGANWDSESESGSRGLMNLLAYPQNGYFQASVAGIGLGFCGIQFASDGSKMFFRGSQDGPGGSCLPVNSTCVSGDDLDVQVDDCQESIGFSIQPLGRTSSSDYLGSLNISQWDASTWPSSGNNVDISDTPNSPVYYGPSSIPLDLLGPQRNFNN